LKRRPSVPWSKKLVVVLTAFVLASCSSSNGETESGDSPRLPGASDALVADAVTNVYVDDPLIDAETEVDANGREIERTRIEIVFADDATVGAANALLTELDATITASLEGLPSLVVRIPDPGSLDALDRLVEGIKARDAVSAVIRSVLKIPTRLPDNVESLIFTGDGSGDSKDAREWRYVAHHLAVRAHAAWNVDAAAKERPMMVFRDTFGQGELPAGVIDATPLFGDEIGMTSVPLPSHCANPTGENIKTCRKLRFNREHGYFSVGIATGEHRLREDDPAQAPLQELVTGMAPNGVQLSVIDGYNQADLQTDKKLFQTLEEIARKNTGMIVLNVSQAYPCDEDSDSGDACSTIDFLRAPVRLWIYSMRVTGLENRVLVVGAASNRNYDEEEEKYYGGHDAKTASDLNAASLIPNWPDEIGGNPFTSLTNTLVVENARRTASPPDREPPFLAECTSASSYLGGHVAGIGGSVFSLIGGSDFPRPNTNVNQDYDGGTSSATPQVAGLAAYMSAIDPSLTPQRAISIIRGVATSVPGTSSNSDCWTVANEPRADLIDAYASVLALDPPGNFSDASARVRLALLDVAGPDGSPDEKFTELDLELLVTLTDPSDAEGAGTLDYGRHDLNGDGRTGGIGTGRFDLDISDVTQAGAFSRIRNRDLEQALEIQGTFDENAVTDRQVLCYYAYTELYEGNEARRDEVLQEVVADCAPCGQPDAAPKAKGFASKQLPEFCEGIVVTVSPDPIILVPGQTQQFTATVTGTENTDVTWSATGGTIDSSGLFSAGTASGDFVVSATSNADESVSDSATVTIFYVDGGYSGLGDEFTDSGGTLESTNVQFQMSVEQVGDQITVRQFFGGPLESSWVFNGTIDGNRIRATTTVENCSRTNSGNAPCEFEGTAKRVDTNTGFFYAIAGKITYDGSETGDDWFVFETDGFSD
jgi:hypothetical protein